MLTYIRALACTSPFSNKSFVQRISTSWFLTNSLFNRLLSGTFRRHLIHTPLHTRFFTSSFLKCVGPRSLFEVLHFFIAFIQHIRPVECPAFRNGQQITFMRCGRTKTIQVPHKKHERFTYTLLNTKKCSFFFIISYFKCFYTIQHDTLRFNTSLIKKIIKLNEFLLLVIGY